MHITNNAKLATTITAILMLTLTIPLSALPVTYADDALEVPTFLELNVAPNPVGVSQTAYINAFLSKPPLTAGLGGSGTMYEDITIEVTRPDGSIETFGPYTSDSTGGTWDTFVPTQTGNYTFKASYPEQHVEEYSTDLFGNTNFYNLTYLASESDTVTLTVQTEPISGTFTPLPTEYWTRPIYSTNYLWGQLGGSWYSLAAPAFATTGDYSANGNFQAYSTAPNIGHIMWTKPTHFGGQVGSPISSDQESQYMTTTIATNFFEPIILNGILYYTEFAGPNAQKSGWTAVDIRTGETLWTRSAGESGTETIRMGQILCFNSIQEYGSWTFLYGVPAAGLFSSPTFMSIYDAYTGEYVANITNIKNPSYIIDTENEQQGTLLGYYTDSGNLVCWNSTKLMMSHSWDKITIRPTGTYNWSEGIEWSVPLDADSSMTSASIIYRSTDEVVLRYAPTSSTFSSLSYGYQTTAAYDGQTGDKLWGPKNQTIPELEDVSVVAAGEDIYVLHDKDTNEAYGYSLETGEKIWGPVELPGNAWSSLSRAAEIAYGKVYIFDFGGYVNALDCSTGAIEWTHVPRNAGYDTSYGIYPLWYNGMIADEKLFISESHMYDPPMYPGAQQLALNTTTGELVWSIHSFTGRVPTVCADGYLIQWNSYDAQIYSIGKGPTETTVVASPKISGQGDSVLVEGTVMDISAGTTQSEQQARFPAGVPAVSDASQSSWMEYVYMQQEKPNNTTGVPITVSVLDPNGNSYVVGETTSDARGHYKLSFVPQISGEYTVIATFEGSESYWGSSQETAVCVTEATATAAPPPTQTPGLADQYFLPMSIVIIVAIVAIGALIALLLLKKRP